MAIPTPPIDTGRNRALRPWAAGRELGRQPRRVVAAIAIVAGAVLVGATLRLPQGGAGFYAAGYALAAVWVVASLVCGNARRTSASGHRFDLALGAAAGVIAFGGFVVAAEIGSRISFLAGPIANVLGKADAGPTIAVLALAWVNGIAEELFFRGVLVDAIGGRQSAVLSVVAYIAVTAVAGNTALTLAAAMMGTVFVAQRMYTRALTASITTHLVWSTLVVLALPR